MRCVRATLIGGLLACAVAPAAAHDFWIEPSTFTPDAGSLVTLRLLVGQHFTGDPLPRDPGLIERFVVVDGKGERDVPGLDGRDPAGQLRPESAGTLVVGLRSRPSVVEIAGEQFMQYLEEEGLDGVREQRRRAGLGAAPARDRFSRCAKSLLVVPGGEPTGHDRNLGFELELIPELHPARIAGGGSLPLRLLYDDRPEVGALIVAIHRDDPARPLSARTDGEGRVRLALERPGGWLIKSVHIDRLTADEEADYESLWASLTLEIPAR